MGYERLWCQGILDSIVYLTTQWSICYSQTAIPRYRFPDGELLLYAPGELPHQCGVPSCFTFQTSKGKFGFWPERGGTFEKGIVYRESLISPKLVSI